MDVYFTIEKPSEAEYKDRGSKFLAFAFPIEDTGDFKKKLQQLKKEHSKAVHHCFAYRIGIDGNNFRVSDDGEPSGTAGKPMLGQLDSKQVTNTAVVVVRYFGGTLLGIPGLINAYKTVTALALQITPIIRKQVEECYNLHFDYTAMNDVMTIIKQFNCTIHTQDMQLFCNMTIGIPRLRLDEVLYSIKELGRVEANAL